MEEFYKLLPSNTLLKSQQIFALIQKNYGNGSVVIKKVTPTIKSQFHYFHLT